MPGQGGFDLQLITKLIQKKQSLMNFPHRWVCRIMFSQAAAIFDHQRTEPCDCLMSITNDRSEKNHVLEDLLVPHH
jgi:hypothetical protein